MFPLLIYQTSHVMGFFLNTLDKFCQIYCCMQYLMKVIIWKHLKVWFSHVSTIQIVHKYIFNAAAYFLPKAKQIVHIVKKLSQLYLVVSY